MIKNVLISFVRYLIRLRAWKLSALEYAAFYLCAYVHVDILVALSWIGALGLRSYPWVVNEHSMSDNYSKEKTYSILSARMHLEEDMVDIPIQFAWLNRHTDMCMSSMRKWVSHAYPKMDADSAIIRVRYVESGKSAKSSPRTCVTQLDGSEWYLDGETDPEPVMFDAFPFFTKQDV